LNKNDDSGNVYSMNQNEVKHDFCDPNVKSKSGYFKVKSGVDKNYFYWFFNSRSKNQSKDPLILWVQGGPGCSSEVAALTEMGPCNLNVKGTDTIVNPYSWNSKANIMFVDQPVNVGYSYGESDSTIDHIHSSSEAGVDMYNFLQEFYKKHPDLLKNELYVMGESYGGHYVPPIAKAILDGNIKLENDKNNNIDNNSLHINLSGIGIGNGITKASIQYQYYPKMAYKNDMGIKTVTKKMYKKMLKHLPECISKAKKCEITKGRNKKYCSYAEAYCSNYLRHPLNIKDYNPYDIRKKCGKFHQTCSDDRAINNFLNLDSTRDALNVSEFAPKRWKECNANIHRDFMGDKMVDFATDYIAPLLDNNIRVLIYAGDADFICNWMGNKAWTKSLQWSGHEDYKKAKDLDWKFGLANDKIASKAGMIRSAKSKNGKGSLTFVRVFGAGHMVPRDKPEVALALVNDFLENNYESQ
jgi:cathepsin A (carboxypeptidase C)